MTAKKYTKKIIKTFAVSITTGIITASQLFSVYAAASQQTSADAVAGQTQEVSQTSQQSADVEYNSYKYKFPDLDLQIMATDELVCFTRNVTSNNSYLELIGVSNVEELRTTMEAQNVYFEAVPRQNVNYEIIISGNKLSNNSFDSLSDLSDEEVTELFQSYIEGCGRQTDTITETVDSSEIYKHNGVIYFKTDITSVSKTLVTVKQRKYYTIMQGKYICFALQTTDKTISEKMDNQLSDILHSAQYKNIDKTIADNPLFTEILTSVITLMAPIAILGIIFFLLIRMTSKKKIK